MLAKALMILIVITLIQFMLVWLLTHLGESPRESGTQNPLRGLVHVRNSPILTRAA